jgi:basic membrane protein A
LKKNQLFLILALLLATVMVLGACGTSDDEDTSDDNATEDTDSTDLDEEGSADFSVAMVTDVGGVDDRSFNQSAWEGIVAFGEEHGLVEKEDYDYAQSDQDADFLPNLNRLVQQDYDLVFGVGFKLQAAIEEIAAQNPDTYFSIIDSVVDADNVASITFAEEQGSFLVGVAAALKTETNHVGFVGGEESGLIKRFETGFVAGVKSVNPDIKVDIDYAESFADASRGRAIASNMYSSGVDVIYHASGDTGNGVFSEAKDIINSDPDAGVWVIGVDRDQYDEGQIGDKNVTLTSMIKRVDVSVQLLANRALAEDFPGGEILTFGIEDDAIGVADTNEAAYTADIAEAVEEWKQLILDGDVVVPETDEELVAYLETL